METNTEHEMETMIKGFWGQDLVFRVLRAYGISYV